MEASCSSSPASLIIHHRSRPSPVHHWPLAASATAARPKIPSFAVAITNLRRPPTQSFPLPLLLRHPQPCLQRPSPRKAILALFQRFNERAIKAAVLSQREARALGESMVGNQHLLLGLVAEDRSPGGFLDSGITIDRAREAVRASWPEGSASEPASSLSAAPVYFSVSTKRVFEAALECARNMGFNCIGPEHIALSLLSADDDSAVQVLRSLGADLSQLALVAHSRLRGKLAKDAKEPLTTSHKAQLDPIAGKLANLRPPEKTKDKNPLTQFCVDLTARASKGLIDPVIGRDTELQRIIQILCRRTKNNPILLGDAGVGKTAIVEGLALHIAHEEVPSFLLEKRILSVDVGLLMAGAKERGELEARVTGLVREVQKSGDIILFIDEVHTIIGAGSVGRGNRASGLDISNLLKPALGRGKLQCIASTTFDEHKIHFEKDKALARRFQPVFIGEPSQEDTVKILLGLREKYEIFHKCRFTLEAINAAVYLSARYIPDRRLPDKAIDLIDEAGSKARMVAFKRKKEQQLSILSKAPEEYWQEIRGVQTMHEVILANKLEAPMNQRITENCGNVDNVKELSRLSAPSSMDYHEENTVGPDEIAKVASLWSGIPVQQLTADERKTLLGLDEELKKRVIGQDDAVSAISRAVKRSRVGLSAPGRPISVMLFCGPTGVGKTELTKALAASYFGSEEAMLRLDMSEYMERHSVSKLVGSPPGYIGYGEGDTLTEAVRRKPFTIILLDEIEKAHPDIFHILLQVFEDGHLTDSQGRRVSFKNTLIVMTSNLGSEAMSKGKRRIGFFLSEGSKSNTYAAMKALVMEELKTFFLPELLNRIDEVVVFRSLGKAQMLEILNVMLKQVEGRLKSLGINLQVGDAMKELVCQQGYNGISYGARPLRRAVTRLIEDVISEAILAGVCHPGDTIVLDVDAAGNPTVTRPPDQTIHLSDAASPL